MTPLDRVQDFWAPLAQIVPVFAIALVLETRRLARGWRLEAKWRRRAQSIVLLVIAYLLIEVESTALAALYNGRGEDSWAAVSIWSVLAAMFLLTFQPIINFAVGGNIDLLFTLFDYLPFTERGRARREFNKAERDFISINKILFDLTDKYYADLVEEKARRKAWKKRVIDLEEFISDPTNSTFNLTADEADTKLTEAKMRVVEANERLALMKKLLGEGRKIWVTGAKMAAKYDRIRAQLAPGNFDRDEIERMRRVIAQGVDWNVAVQDTASETEEEIRP